MTTIIENLHAMRSQLDAMIAAAQADGSGDKVMLQMPKAGKAKAPKAEKKERANAGVPTLHGAWTTHVLKEHSTESTEFKEFLAARIASAQAGELLYNEGHAKVKKGKKQVGDAMDEKEAAVGAHTVFVSFWKSEHPEEHAEFKSAWEAANPKESRVPSSKASVASGEESEGSEKPAPKKRGAMKDSDRTPEDLARVKAERAAKKAAKAATKAEAEDEEADDFGMETVVSAKTPSAAIGGSGIAAAPAAPEPEEKMLEAEDEPENSLIPFIHKKVKYLRYGHLDEDGEGVWDEGGDLWLQTANGGKGAYAGQIQASGKIDASPQVLANEPEI